MTRTDDNGNTYWSARDLSTAMGYTSWQRFTAVLDRARNTAENLGMDLTSAFNTNVERVPAGDGWKDRTDVNLSRFAAYLVAMNGDPRKPQVAAAQAYFTQATLMQEGHIPSATPEPVQEDPQPTASGPIVGVPVELATSLVTAIQSMTSLMDRLTAQGPGTTVNVGSASPTPAVEPAPESALNWSYRVYI